MTDEESSVVYKDIPGFPGYRVGDDGSVWSCRKPGKGVDTFYLEWKKLKPFVMGTKKVGFRLGVTPCPEKLKKAVSRLVLQTFIGPCPEGLEACHNDGNFKNNKLENLRWDTHKANCADRLRHGTDVRGEQHGRSKLTEDQVRSIRRDYAVGGARQRDLAKKYGISQTQIGNICRGTKWKHVE